LVASAIAVGYILTVNQYLWIGAKFRIYNRLYCAHLWGISVAATLSIYGGSGAEPGGQSPLKLKENWILIIR